MLRRAAPAVPSGQAQAWAPHPYLSFPPVAPPPCLWIRPQALAELYSVQPSIADAAAEGGDGSGSGSGGEGEEAAAVEAAEGRRQQREWTVQHLVMPALRCLPGCPPPDRLTSLLALSARRCCWAGLPPLLMLPLLLLLVTPLPMPRAPAWLGALFFSLGVPGSIPTWAGRWPSRTPGPIPVSPWAPSCLRVLPVPAGHSWRPPGSAPLMAPWWS